VSLVATPAEAASKTFTVNTAGDQPDADVTDRPNRCDTDLITAGDQCTLRAAIDEANATRDADKITFAIPGGGMHTIPAQSSLHITRPVTIDGYTQPAATANTIPLARDGTNAALKIGLTGASAGVGAIGLLLNTSNVTVRGLVITDFSVAGIFSGRGGGHRIQGNFIGTDAAGTSTTDGNGSGVAFVDTDASHIGGASPSARNVIVKSDKHAGSDGILIQGTSRGNKIQGNLIGTKAFEGTLGNTSSGIELSEPSKGTTVGGAGSAANVIALNLGNGVTAASTTGNRILGNMIAFNGGLGIDLGGDGVTPNDEGDADTGANRLQNFPVWEFAHSTLDGNGIRIGGRLESRPNTRYTIELFVSTFNDPTGFGEGDRYLGRVNLTTDRHGERRFIFEFDPARPVGEDEYVTATATDRGSKDTSEFSQVFKFDSI
jgi:CSLREA domain-containing protein